MPLDDITSINCEDLHNSPALANHRPTARKVIKQVRQIYQFAMGNRGTAHNPTDGLQILKLKKPRRPRVTDAEFEALYRTLWAYPKPVKWNVLLACNTPCRLEEAAYITPNEIDIPKRIWTISGERAKTDEPHPYYRSSAQMIQIARNAAGWTSATDKYHGMRNLFEKLRKQLGIQRCGLHTLRRYLAKKARDEFGREASSIYVGHEPEMNDIYTEDTESEEAKVQSGSRSSWPKNSTSRADPAAREPQLAARQAWPQASCLQREERCESARALLKGVPKSRISGTATSFSPS